MLIERKLPSLPSIRAFEAAARLGSFSNAGRELGTSAASVSYHLKQLERQIGMTLFRRHAHSVELTPSGTLIAREVTAAFDALRASFLNAAELDQALLSVSALPTFGTSWLIPRLGLFRSANPQIKVDLDLSPVSHDLSAGLFDAAIRNGHGRWPGLRAIELFPSIFTPLCAPALLPAAGNFADPKRSLDVTLLGRADWWQAWYGALGHGEAPAAERFGLKLADEHLDAAAAIAGQGITIGSPILFAAEIEAGRLVPAHDLVVHSGRGFWLAYPAARDASQKIAAFRAWLSDEAASARAAAQPFLASCRPL